MRIFSALVFILFCSVTYAELVAIPKECVAGVPVVPIDYRRVVVEKAKVFFLSQPNRKAQSKGSLKSGDEVQEVGIAGKGSGAFSCVVYDGGNGKIIIGWIPSRELCLPSDAGSKHEVDDEHLPCKKL